MPLQDTQREVEERHDAMIGEESTAKAAVFGPGRMTIERHHNGKTYILATGVRIFVPKDKSNNCLMVGTKDNDPLRIIGRRTAKVLLGCFRRGGVGGWRKY